MHYYYHYAPDRMLYGLVQNYYVAFLFCSAFFQHSQLISIDEISDQCSNAGGYAPDKLSKSVRAQLFRDGKTRNSTGDETKSTEKCLLLSVMYMCTVYYCVSINHIFIRLDGVQHTVHHIRR